jgi:putative tricarboxylic transport membrane protein
MATDKLKAIVPYAALLAGAAFLYDEAGRFAYAAKPGGLGPGVWPKAILLLLIAICAYEIVRRTLFVRRSPKCVAATETLATDAADPAPETQPADAARHPYLLLAGIALTVLYVLALDSLGFFLATALYLALFMAVGRYRRLGVIVTTSVAGSLAFVLVFMKVVYVSLPLGTGPFQSVSVWLLSLLGIR